MNRNRVMDDYAGLELLKKEKLVRQSKLVNYRCKKCGFETPKEEEISKLNFWLCSECGRGNKISDKIEITKDFFYINIDKLRKRIKNALESNGFKTKECSGELIVYNEKGELPVLLLEFVKSSSILNEAIEKKAIILFFHKRESKRYENIYNKSTLIRITDFLDYSNEKIKELIESELEENNYWETLSIQRKVSNFCSKKHWKDFEIETTKLFNSLRNKKSEIKKLLANLEKNKSNPSGAKYIHVGGNYELDIVQIQLYNYINELLQLDERKGIDTKKYSNNLDFQTYQNKILTNTGSQVIIITNAESIDGRIWKDIILAKNRQGRWWNFIVDLDILSLVLCFVGVDNFYN